MRKHFILLSLFATAILNCLTTTAQDKPLQFNRNNFTLQTLRSYSGEEIKFRAYEGICYVTNPEDTAFQTLNIYVPEQTINKHQGIPVFVRTYVGGYMAAKAKSPSIDDATGRALQEGYVVCIVGSRGSNSVINNGGMNVFTGRAPNALLDLKAAIRYLKYNDSLIEGDCNLIITDGTSAGGAMSALLGSSGNHPAFEKALQTMGAASATDDVFASVCYCPITDLNHADMAYEWLFSCTNDSVRALNKEMKQISEELSVQFPAYINSLKLTAPKGMRLLQEGDAITSDNYMDYLKSWLILSFQKAKNEGVTLPENIGIVLNATQPPMMNTTNRDNGKKVSDNDKQNSNNMPTRRGGGDFGGDRPPMMGGGGGFAPQGGNFGGGDRPRNRGNDFGNNNYSQTPNEKDNRKDRKDKMMMQKRQGEFVIDIDMVKYLNYVASNQTLKYPPAFDSKDVYKGAVASAENNVFGNEYGSSANFTQYSIMKAQGNSAKTNNAVIQNVRLYNPMTFIGNDKAVNAPHWYIRHGALDRDTSFPIAVNLATKLMNSGKNVNFALPYNRNHSGDYNLDDLFSWIKDIIQ